MARTETSPSLDWAADRYKTIRGTIKKAKENNINIVRHWVKYTKRGAVYQHLFLVKNSDGSLSTWTNQELSVHIWVYTQGKNKTLTN